MIDRGMDMVSEHEREFAYTICVHGRRGLVGVYIHHPAIVNPPKLIYGAPPYPLFWTDN